MATIRVLVVDDSLTVRRRLVEVIAAAPGFDVVGEAGDGHEAVRLCRDLRPDVVTLDLMLPGLSGLEVTEQIMAFCPTPILVVSSAANRGTRVETYQALAAGAVDALDKADALDGAWSRQLVARLRLVSRIKVITHPRARLRPSPPAAPAPGAASAAGAYALVAIGASTGGPGAIVQLLRQLPPDFRLPILLVLHLGEPFGPAFAEWLAGQSALPVAEARDGMALPDSGAPGIIWAPPGRHLAVSPGRLRLTDAAERHACRPSVDVLFESVAATFGPRAIGCLLTGMGRDGAAGLLAMRRAGAATIAQDEATSVVWGMPREAVRLGAAGAVLPLSRIGPAIQALAAGRFPEISS
ncbi:Chemotaxis response regulator protein-glutamate methylesterase of group 1 operon [compost metagenome]